jgi:DNA-binding transcriptional LysR family regulator
MDLELRHLRLIVAVAEQGSVTRAAAALGIAQPALTAQLNRIDRSLGGQVFTRDQRGARPTALGELVLGRARMVLPAVESLLDDVQQHVNRGQDGLGTLRVGTVASALAGRFVHRLVTGLPDVRVTTSTSWSVEDTARQLSDGTLDVALVGLCSDATPPAAPGVTWWRVDVDPVFVLLPDAHPHADGPTVDLGDLADEVWLSGPGDGCFERCFAQACARAGFTPSGLSEADRPTVIDLVQAGHAIALVQPTFPDTPGTQVVPLAGTPLRWSHHVGWRGGEHLPVEVLVEAAVRSHHDAVSRSPRYLWWLDAYGETLT